MIRTKKEIAEIYKISIGTVDKSMLNGLPFIKIRKSVRFDEDKVKSWFEENQKG